MRRVTIGFSKEKRREQLQKTYVGGSAVPRASAILCVKDNPQTLNSNPPTAMLIDTLLLLMSTAALAMALGTMPAILAGPSASQGSGYWACGCFALSWSWLIQGIGEAMPLNSAAVLADGFLIIAITSLAQAAQLQLAHGSLRLNPLWPTALFLVGYLLAVFIPSLWPVRHFFAAGIVAWIACRTCMLLLRKTSGAPPALAIGFLAYGIFVVTVMCYRLLSGHIPVANELDELVVRMVELTLIVFLTTSFLASRSYSLDPQNPPIHSLTLDAVAGCLNRAAIESRYKFEFARHRLTAEPMTVLMIDLDQFKAVNDTHGHPAGDAALRSLAQALAKAIRATDALGRYGGDEFLIILPQTNTTEAARVVERMRSALAQIPDQPEPLTMSVGLAQSRPDDHPETIIQRADEALYRAKREGRDRAVTAETTPAG